MRKNNIRKAEQLLKQIGMPPQQQKKLSCLTLLALLGVNKTSDFSEATNQWVRIHELLMFMNSEYKADYKENSRESVRKEAIHHFRNAALIEDNGMATNSPAYRYRITTEFLKVVRNFDVDSSYLKNFLRNHTDLISLYASRKRVKRMPVKINDKDFTFSPGKHNQLQKAIIEEFAPRFAPNSECLYVGDSDMRDMYKNVEQLEQLGFEITLHDKMPDVVLYRADKNWIYFIESVTSVGPMNSKRIKEITDMTQNVTAGKIFVTAFLDRLTFKKFCEDLAWETEVWIADNPDHLIHLNGDRFMGPHTSNQG